MNITHERFTRGPWLISKSTSEKMVMLVLDNTLTRGTIIRCFPDNEHADSYVDFLVKQSDNWFINNTQKETNMSNKTPYELRLDILTLAKSYLDDIQRLENSVAETAFNEALETKNATPEDWDLCAPKQYTMDDLMDVAKQMYDFVLTK